MTKAVLLGAAAVVGLERALHFGPPRPSGLPAAFGSMLIDRCNGSMLATPSMPGTVRPVTVGATCLRQQHQVRATVADPSMEPRVSTPDGHGRVHGAWSNLRVGTGADWYEQGPFRWSLNHRSELPNSELGFPQVWTSLWTSPGRREHQCRQNKQNSCGQHAPELCASRSPRPSG